MKRGYLIDILKRKLPNDFKVNDDSNDGSYRDFIIEKSNIETRTIHISKYSEKLKCYITILKCYTYSSHRNSGWKLGDPIIWYFDFNLDDVYNKQITIPEESTEDFVDLFLNRYSSWLRVKSKLSKIQNSIFILSQDDKVRSEIRNFKIENITKSENQE